MENIVNVSLEVRTGRDDKECGVFSVRIYQGSHEFYHRDFGDGQDWNEGHTLTDSMGLQLPATNEAIRCVVALEERPGQKTSLGTRTYDTSAFQPIGGDRPTV